MAHKTLETAHSPNSPFHFWIWGWDFDSDLFDQFEKVLIQFVLFFYPFYVLKSYQWGGLGGPRDFSVRPSPIANEDEQVEHMDIEHNIKRKSKVNLDGSYDIDEDVQFKETSPA